MKTRKVLIVDDDQIIREQLEKELKRHYCETFLAVNGKQAKESFNDEDIEIVLLDVNLPDTDGLEFLKQIKTTKPNCEIIVITGYGTEEIAIKALRRGAIDYLEKPIKLDELAAALGRAQEKLDQNETLSFKNTVLVIDDDEKVVKLLAKVLVKEEYEVFTAGGGKEGLDIIEKNKVDVMITDINMGDMNGIEVLQGAKKLYQDIEGIVVTGQKDEALAIEALRVGAIDYLNKPINLDELLISVKKAINNINLNRNRLYRDREQKISTEIIAKMNEELERRIEERSKELTQTQTQLFQTSKLATLGEMSTGLAHEINQPLGGIALICAGIRKMIEKGKLTDEQLNIDLDDIETSIKRMTKVIQHMRTFARQDTLRFSEVTINDTIESALSLLGEQLRLHEVEVQLNLASDLPKISGEPYQLEQVWINFIANARDAVEHKEQDIKDGKLQKDGYRKKLTISSAISSDPEGVEIKFTDNGIGLSKEKCEKMFEPFFTTKEVGKGSGLGLSISYGIIENHKGQIEAESTEGEGTTMRVVLPIGKPEEENG